MFLLEFKFIEDWRELTLKLLLGLIKLKSKMKRPIEESFLVPERISKLIHKLRR